GGGIPVQAEGADQSLRAGLRRQRSRRGAGGGYRHCRRPRRRLVVPARRSGSQGPGSTSGGGTEKGNRRPRRRIRADGHHPGKKALRLAVRRLRASVGNQGERMPARRASINRGQSGNTGKYKPGCLFCGNEPRAACGRLGWMELRMLLMIVQVFFAMVVGFYFLTLLRNQKSNRIAVDRESRKELEKLRKMRAISLTKPLAEQTRPGPMSDIVGQQDGLKALKAALCSGNPQHVIIYGPPGVGKTAAARVVLEEAKKNPKSPFRQDAKFLEI